MSDRFDQIPENIRIPGGCDDCLAYQTFDKSQAPIFRITVHHDETCPYFGANNAKWERLEDDE